MRLAAAALPGPWAAAPAVSPVMLTARRAGCAPRSVRPACAGASLPVQRLARRPRTGYHR